MPRTISDNLIRLEQAKTDIGTAINSYGFDTPSNSTLTTYPTTINTIGTDINGTLETCLGTGSGHSIVVDKTITTNGVYNPLDDNAYAYDEVTVNVANSYEESDEGKVVSNGSLVAQTAYPSTITENGTYDTTLNNSVTVNVPTGAIIIPIIETTNYLRNLTAYLIIYNNNKIILAGEYSIKTRVYRTTTIIFNYDSNLDLNDFTQPYYAVLTGGFYASGSQAIRYNLTFDFSNKTITLSNGEGSSSIDDSSYGTISTYG